MLVFVGATGFLKPVRRASLALYFRVQRPILQLRVSMLVGGSVFQLRCGHRSEL